MVLDIVRKIARFLVLINRESCEVENAQAYRKGDGSYER